jgi:hypothetical protein
MRRRPVPALIDLPIGQGGHSVFAGRALGISMYTGHHKMKIGRPTAVFNLQQQHSARGLSKVNSHCPRFKKPPLKQKPQTGALHPCGLAGLVRDEERPI